MRHLKAGRKFGRNPSHRKAMFRNLTANLILHERIETTDAKAKELRRVTERLITKAVRLGEVAYVKPTGSSDDKAVRDAQAKRLHVERMLRSKLPRFGVRTLADGSTEKVDIVEKVLVELAQRFQGRKGGYTRIVKLGPRRGDNAPMSIIEFVDRKVEEDATEDQDVVDAVVPEKEEKVSDEAKETEATSSDEAKETEETSSDDNA